MPIAVQVVNEWISLGNLLQTPIARQCPRVRKIKKSALLDDWQFLLFHGQAHTWRYTQSIPVRVCNSASTKSFGREKDVSGGGGVVQLGSEFFRFILKRKTPLYCCCWCTCWKCNVFMVITTWMHYRSILHLEQLPWICMQHCLSGRVQWQLKHIHYLWTRFIPNHFALSLHPSLLSSKCWPSISETPKEKPTPTSPCVLSRRIRQCFRCCQDRMTACSALFLPTFHISQP